MRDFVWALRSTYRSSRGLPLPRFFWLRFVKAWFFPRPPTGAERQK